MKVRIDAAKIRGLRLARGLMASFVAKNLGMTPSDYSVFENGKRYPDSINKLYKTAKFFNVKIEDLLEVTE